MDVERFTSILGLMVIVVPVGAVILWLVLHKNRTQRLQEIAKELNFQFAGEAFQDLFAFRFDLCKKGKSHRFDNILRQDKQGGVVTVCDYWRVDLAGFTDSEGQRKVVQTICIMKIPGRSLPRMLVRRKGIIERIAELLSITDVESLEDRDFFRFYKIVTKPNITGKVFTREMRSLFDRNRWVFSYSRWDFLGSSFSTPASVEIDEDAILINCGVMIPASSVRSLVNFGREMLTILMSQTADEP